jgi:hypothetical protein
VQKNDHQESPPRFKVSNRTYFGKLRPSAAIWVRNAG